MMEDKLSPSEAIFAFASWLTTRYEPTVFSAKHDAAPIAQRVKEFCEKNNFSEPRDHWEENFEVPE